MRKRKQKVLLVVDGSNVLNRAYHAIPPMETSSGISTNAIKGTVNILSNVIAKVKPTHIVFTLDNKSKNFRHELHPEYKGKRVKDPEKSYCLNEQTPIVRDIVKNMGITLVSKKGIEADDIVGTVVRAASEQDEDILIYILSNDKDFAQLLKNPRITILKNNNKTKEYDYITRSNCEEFFDVPANRTVERLAIEGDKVDNIIGLKGFGIGAIKKLVASGKDMDSYDLSVLNKSQRALWESSQDTLKLNVDLVKIRTKIIDISLDDMKVKQANLERILGISNYIEARGLGLTIKNTVVTHLKI